MIYLISGNGQGSGKTTLARKLVGEASVWSIASELRRDLRRLYPSYDWENKTQEYKDNTSIIEQNGATVRQVMIDFGQAHCRDDPNYWVKKLVARLASVPALSVVAVDDLRKSCELEYFKTFFPQNVHFHVRHESAIGEPMYDGAALEAVADYVCDRR